MMNTTTGIKEIILFFLISLFPLLVKAQTTGSDLVIVKDSLSLDTLKPAQTLIDYTLSIVNQGATASSPTRVEFYISKDSVFSSSDIDQNNSINIPSIPAGDTIVITSTNIGVTSPSLQEEWFIIAFVYPEFDEEVINNNTSSEPFLLDNFIPPGDNYIESAGVQDTTFAGDLIPIGFKAFTAPFGDFNYYISKDSIHDTNDKLLSIVSNPVINVDTVDATIQIPLATREGDWFIIINLDIKNVVAETDERNNSFHLSIYIKEPLLPDLIPDSLSVSPSITTPGSSFTVKGLTKNIGDISSVTSQLNFYLSVDPVFSTRDMLLDQNTIGVLSPAGESTLQSFSFNINSDTTGTWYVLAVADGP